MRIHHATIAFAAKHGVEILEAGKGFRLVQIVTGQLSEDTFDTAGEISETLRADGVEGITWEKPRTAKGIRSGVMAIGFHKEYSNNPDGPGCNDDLDVTLRRATAHLGEDGKPTGSMDRAKLIAVGEANGLWRFTWNSLNPGMGRMNLANRMRGWLRNNDGHLVIGDQSGRFGIARIEKAKRVRKAKAPSKAKQAPAQQDARN